MSWDLILSSLASKTDLSSEQARWAMSQILQGNAENEKIVHADLYKWKQFYLENSFILFHQSIKIEHSKKFLETFKKAHELHDKVLDIYMCMQIEKEMYKRGDTLAPCW